MIKSRSNQGAKARVWDKVADTPIRIKPMTIEYPKSLRRGKSKLCKTCSCTNNSASTSLVSLILPINLPKNNTKAMIIAIAKVNLIPIFLFFLRRQLTIAPTILKGIAQKLIGERL